MSIFDRDVTDHGFRQAIDNDTSDFEIVFGARNLKTSQVQYDVGPHDLDTITRTIQQVMCKFVVAGLGENSAALCHVIGCPMIGACFFGLCMGKACHEQSKW